MTAIIESMSDVFLQLSAQSVPYPRLCSDNHIMQHRANFFMNAFFCGNNKYYKSATPRCLAADGPESINSRSHLERESIIRRFGIDFFQTPSANCTKKQSRNDRISRFRIGSSRIQDEWWGRFDDREFNNLIERRLLNFFVSERGCWVLGRVNSRCIRRSGLVRHARN